MMDSSPKFNGVNARILIAELAKTSGRSPLSTKEEDILEGCCDGLTYAQIAEQLHREQGTIADIASERLWPYLSELCQTPIKKSNVVAVLREKWESHGLISFEPVLSPNTAIRNPPHPDDGPLPSPSLFYIERGIISDRYSQEIIKQGALIRVKGAKAMGKTSFVRKLLQEASSSSTCYIDIDRLEQSVLSSLDIFLQYLCRQVSQSQALANDLESYWDDELLTATDNCSHYFEQAILKEIPQDLILALDGLDRLFTCDAWVEDVLKMLRDWHERAKNAGLWKRLRIIFTYSTEACIAFDMRSSPLFSVGIPIQLSPFNERELQLLVDQYELSLDPQELTTLEQVLGGHPYLTQKVLYEVRNYQRSLTKILETAADEGGLFINHLRCLLEKLYLSPALLDSYQTVVRSPQPISLQTFHIYQLQGLGLIKLQKNDVEPSCQLYRTYFQRVL